MASFFVNALIYIQLFICITTSANGIQNIPKNFKFGVATSAYQIEGAWKSADKSQNIWDNFTHEKPSKISDGSTGDVACDSYNLYKRDVEMLRELGVDFYRFSISWSRLLPSGFVDKVSRDGLKYYNSLLDELLLHNITPHVTLYHWDLPQKLQELGGWSNPLMVNYFIDYARVVFDSFGSKVKVWITFNGPTLMCTNGYGTDKEYAPSVSFPGVMEYLCGHHVLLAHAGAYNLYKNQFKSKQNGRVGVSLYSPWIEPFSNSTRDQEISEIGMQFALGWFANPLFSKTGDYPEAMRSAVRNRSIQQGYTVSRLPQFTPEQTQLLNGSADFLGINYYTSLICREYLGQRPHFPEPSVADDIGFESFQSNDWEPSSSSWLRINPPGIRKVLSWIRHHYGNPEVLVTEAGVSTGPGLLDLGRVAHLQQTLTQVALAAEEGCNVTALAVWSLMDNFQWTSGYTERFGLYEVDFRSSKRTRTIRISGLVYRNIIETKVINPFYSPTIPGHPYASAASRSLSFQIATMWAVTFITLSILRFIFNS